MKLKGDIFWGSLALIIMIGGPFWAESSNQEQANEEFDSVRIVVKSNVKEYIPQNTSLELWSVDSEHIEPDYSYIPLDKSLAEVLVECCLESNVPLELALALMEQESGFQVDAVGPDGHDFGLFQIRDSNHAWLMGETGADPMTTEGNIRCGVWMLSYLLDHYGDQDAALTAYRYGYDNSDRAYANAVLEAAERWA